GLRVRHATDPGRPDQAVVAFALDIHDPCGMSHGCDTSPSRSTPGEYLPGGHIVGLVSQGREAPLAEGTVRGPEDVDEPPVVVLELLVEKLVAWRIEVLLDDVGDARPRSAQGTRRPLPRPRRRPWEDQGTSRQLDGRDSVRVLGGLESQQVEPAHARCRDARR